MDRITVTIAKYDKFKGRKDVENPSWFKLSNRLLEDPDFYEFSALEILVWIRILSIASQKQTPTVILNLDHTERVCRIGRADVLSAVQKLSELKILSVESEWIDVTHSRNADVTPTLRRTLRGIEKNRIEENREEEKEYLCTEPSKLDSAQTQIFELDEFSKPILKKVDSKIQSAWLALYGDKEWIEKEIKSASLWCMANSQKAPKSNQARFLTNWLKNGWERHRKSIQSNPDAKLNDDLAYLRAKYANQEAK